MRGTVSGAILVLVALVVVGAVCGNRRIRAAGPTDEGLTFRLSEGAEQRPVAATTRPSAAEPLSDADAQRVLDRLPPMAPAPDDAHDFALREKSLPAPRPGPTQLAPFPPPSEATTPETAAGTPLEILRRSPEGEVALAPNLSVTFSQPMVAVTSQDEAAQHVPVRLTPLPAGQWRWIGTKTLLFEPKGRFAMATEYAVEVPAGTKSAGGGTLARAVRWQFATPAPTIVAKHPVEGPARTDALLFVAFDQRVDPKAVLQATTLGRTPGLPRLRLATAEEVATDGQVRALAARAEPGRWVALRPESPLPTDTRVRVTVATGTPSLEGTRTTRSAQQWSFRTFGPMRVKSQRCGWSGACRPSMQWQIELSNPIDVKAFRAEMVRVEPELPAMKAETYGSTLVIRGASKGRTVYQVTLSPELPDQFGQTLGQSAPLSFRVGPAEPALWTPAGNRVVLDPRAKPALSVYSVNHARLDVTAYAVTPTDWEAFLKFTAREKGLPVPGRVVHQATVDTRGAADEIVETSIDLAPALPKGTGQLVITVRPAGRAAPERNSRRQQVDVWVEATHLALDAFVDATEALAWVSSLEDGRPLEGVTVELVPAGTRATTGPDGLARLPLAATPQKVLVARRGDDVAILPESAGAWGHGWQRHELAAETRWHVFSDRGLYQPGEEAHLKGWVRLVSDGEGGDVEAHSGTAKTAHYVLRDSRRNEIVAGDAPLNTFGGFDLTLKLPPTMNLGSAVVELSLPPSVDQVHRHALEVQEFRRPEFEVRAELSAGPHFVSAQASVVATAAYYAGGALPDAETTWRVEARPGHFTPPNRGDFVFGHWSPWWEYRDDESQQTKTATWTGRTDAAGRHTLSIDFDAGRPARAWSVSAEATVRDVNRQAWTASAALLVHPASLYVGVKSERLFVQQGEPLRLSAIVTDLDGRAVAGRAVTLRAERLDWSQVEGEWRERPVDPQEQRLTSGVEPVSCSFATRHGGPYRITATVTDERGRANETELRLWVAGGAAPPRRGVESEKVTLIPAQQEYRAGETAEILVAAPFANAEGLLTLRRSGLFRAERFKIQGASHTIRIPIEEAWTPNVIVQVDLIGAAARVNAKGEVDAKLPPRPAYASGVITLQIPPYQRTLRVAATPREKALEPGGQTELSMEVRDVSGAPLANSEVVVVVADEAVLALSGYKLPDPLQTFYSPRAPATEDAHSRAALQLASAATLRAGGGLDEPLIMANEISNLEVARPAAPPATRRGRMAGYVSANAETKVAGGGAPIALRSDFNPLALFVASAVTDAQGRAVAKVKLPDNLTRYRVMVVATDGAKRFGKGESAITARLPLMVRPSAPRFLNFGDRFDLPIVVQNQTDAAMTVDVAARTSNARLTGGPGRRLIVPANDRVEVRLPAATLKPGQARFQVGAASGRWADAAEVALPVWTPATTEAFATYGEIDDEKAVVQPVRAPSGIVREYGGLEITTSSTALQALTDAMLYLVAYRFECAEQLSSRVLAVAALKDVLSAFDAQGLPKPEETVAAVTRDLDRLKGLQNNDGGFGFWRRGEESWPYLSIHAAHALVRAREKGFAVDDDTLNRSKEYLRRIESHIPKWYSDEARWTLTAYALDVRRRAGDRDTARARALLARAGADKLPIEALAWLLAVLSGDEGSRAEVAVIRLRLANAATETASTAHFAVSYGDSAYLLLHSDRRADAIALEALIGDQPQNGLIPKLVQGLLGHRKAGRWLNTQENVFVLLALDRYFHTYEKVTPDFVARAWLGERFAGEHAFKGRTTERSHLAIPMRYVEEGRSQNLVLAKQGPGRLYYRIGMEYAPADLMLKPADRGFFVERRYEGVDNATDVRRDADGAWHLKAGSRVRVRLTMVAPSRRYHVALVDPLPAGLEPLNPALATTGTVPPGAEAGQTVTVVGAPGLGGPQRPGWWWWRTQHWYEHQNLRDERVEAFTSLLFEGVYEYAYVARTTTPGVFVVPPVKAEEMYAPETFGRGASDRVIVE